jgi:myo-inositol 2-dehydrogenase/D-chiro-inositol 1-dehydrogenase
MTASDLSRGSRRDFLKASTAAAVAGGAAASVLTIGQSAHAAGSDVLKVGLVGCGGRGTGAAAQALAADPNVKLTAMADAFEDRLEESLSQLSKRESIAGKLDVPRERRFVGFDGCRQLLDSGVDVVLLCTPPQFRPAHLKLAVDKGVHVFAEKPVAVDSPGVRSVLATCTEAEKKGLAVVSGLCLRYSLAFQETIRRIHDGEIGEVVTLQANDYRGPIWLKPRQPDWTDMHWQMRNWYYFTWLSGDFNVEQHVHFLDVIAWVMREKYPVKAVGMGGRQQRTGPEYGNIYDHHSVVYEYEDGAKLFSNCRQIPGCKNDMSAHAVGTKGKALISERRPMISGLTHWAYDGQKNDVYQTEHDELFASIRSGKPINNGAYMALSSLMAIMGRMATYTGQEITWEMALNSQEDLTPAKFEWGPIATPAIAVPGVTRFV